MEFPELQGKISGGNPPIPPHVTMQQQFLSIIHMIAIAFIFIGDSLWNMIPFLNGPPQWYQTCKAYPMQTFMGLFFVLPTLIQNQLTTGAFEIMLDGDVLFSKIELGRFPNGPELVELFGQVLKK